MVDFIYATSSTYNHRFVKIGNGNGSRALCIYMDLMLVVRRPFIPDFIRVLLFISECNIALINSTH